MARDAARRQALLRTVRRHRAGLTIYALARRLGRPYRRVFDAVHRLAAEGALRLQPVTRGNRRATLVSPRAGAGGAPLPLPAHLTEAERQALAALRERLARLDRRIRSVELFGSRARGDSNANSDLDLAVRVRGKRDAALERRIVAACAEVEWDAPLEGALRISPLVLFDARRRAPVDRWLENEAVIVWKAHAWKSPAGNSRRRQTS